MLNDWRRKYEGLKHIRPVGIYYLPCDQDRIRLVSQKRSHHLFLLILAVQRAIASFGKKSKWSHDTTWTIRIPILSTIRMLCWPGQLRSFHINQLRLHQPWATILHCFTLEKTIAIWQRKKEGKNHQGPNFFEAGWLLLQCQKWWSPTIFPTWQHGSNPWAKFVAPCLLESIWWVCHLCLHPPWLGVAGVAPNPRGLRMGPMKTVNRFIENQQQEMNMHINAWAWFLFYNWWFTILGISSRTHAFSWRIVRTVNHQR